MAHTTPTLPGDLKFTTGQQWFTNPKHDDSFTLASVTSPRACGKSTLGEGLESVATSPNRVVCKDCSWIIDLAAKQHGQLGRMMSEQIKIKRTGGLMEDDAVNKAMRWYIDALRIRVPSLRLLIIPGFARTPEQLALLSEYGGKLIHISGSLENSVGGVHLRDWLSGKKREDSHDGAIRMAWEEYLGKTLPAAKQFKDTLHLEHDMPLLEKLVASTEHVIRDQGLKNKMLRRLMEHDNHAIHTKIAELKDNNRRFQEAEQHHHKHLPATMQLSAQ